MITGQEEGVDVVVKPFNDANALYYDIPTLHHRNGAVHVPASTGNYDDRIGNESPLALTSLTEKKEQNDNEDMRKFKKTTIRCGIIIAAILASVGLVIGMGVVASENKRMAMSSAATYVEGCPESDFTNFISSDHELPTSITDQAGVLVTDSKEDDKTIQYFDDAILIDDVVWEGDGNKNVPFNRRLRRLKFNLSFLQNQAQKLARRLSKPNGCHDVTTGGTLQSAENSSGKFLICRENLERPGFGLEEFDSGYVTGRPIYSEVTGEDVDTALNDGLETAQVITGTISEVTGLFDATPLKAISAFFSGVSGILGVATIWAGKSDLDVVQALIDRRFDQLSQQISKLSDMVSEGFSIIRKDLVDNELDELMGYLQAINYAHKYMIDAVLTNGTKPEVKKIYVDRYRDACNRPQFTAEDIFRQLYGFACGDKGKERSCDATDGADTGVCKYGVKKRQYIQDVYTEVTDGLPIRFQSFGDWLLKAMLLAQFHSSTCLPKDAASCIDPSVDPTRKKIASEQNASFVEVANNIERALDCLVDDKFLRTLNEPTFYQDNTKVPGLSDCLNSDDDDGLKNKCMAGKVLEVLKNQFSSKHWAVVVYIDDSNGIHYEGSENNPDFGMIHLERNENLGNRVIHLMYRNRLQPEKDFTYLDELGTSRDVFQDSERGYETVGVLVHDDGSCFGDPLLRSNDTPQQQNPIDALARDQGFIAWNLKAPGKPQVSSTSFHIGYNFNADGYFGWTQSFDKGLQLKTLFEFYLPDIKITELGVVTDLDNFVPADLDPLDIPVIFDGTESLAAGYKCERPDLDPSKYIIAIV